MPKKYKINPPKKCKTCEKAAECEFLTMLDQKPFDASGVILDCRAFYIVFCDLEERCRIPFGEPGKMKQYHEESEEGNRPYLTPALVTNGVLAAELALKALTLRETGTFDCIHDLDKLYYALPEKHKAVLTARIKEESHQNDTTLKVNLETISDFFVDWRYFFEFHSIGYSNFLTEFIHIVCDYALETIEQNMREQKSGAN